MVPYIICEKKKYQTRFLISYQHTFFVIKSDERSGRGGEEEKIGEGKERPKKRRSRKGKK